jgi:transcriptional regulator with XRE-family HTH domain
MRLHLAIRRFMNTEEVLDALERYTKESDETDRETATKLGVNQVTLSTWLRRASLPQKCMLARLAGFLKRMGYI